MKPPKPKLVLKVVEKVVYSALLFVGCYFIHKGSVIERFVQERTNFADFDEGIREIPTILTYIEKTGGETLSQANFLCDFHPSTCK